MDNLFAELKRRKVFRVAAVYAVAAWLLIQVAATVFPALQLPDWTVTFVTLLFLLGFPVALILAWAYEKTPEGVRPDHLVQSSPAMTATSAQPINYLILLIVLIMAGVQVFDRAGRDSGSEPESATTIPRSGSGSVTRLPIAMPANQDFSLDRGDFDIAPDGSFFVYRSPIAGGDGLWLRRFDALEATPIPGTGTAYRVRISPDSSEVVYTSSGFIRVTPLSGGITRTVTDGNSDTPNWSADGEYIYFQDRETFGISRISAQGGVKEVVTTVDAEQGERNHGFPEPLPSTDYLLFRASRNNDPPIIYALDLRSGEKKALVEGKYPVYSNTGHLLFQHATEPTLYAAAFDASTLELTGPPMPIADRLIRVGSENAANIGLSETGRLLYRTYGDTSAALIPTLITRDGTEHELDTGWALEVGSGVLGIALSPGGDRLALAFPRPPDSTDIWVKDLNQGQFSRMTFRGFNLRPSWTPDGEELLFISQVDGGRRTVWSRRADGGGIAAETLISTNREHIHNVEMSPDGRYLVFRAGDGLSFRQSDLFYLETSGERVQRPLVEDEFATGQSAISPDGRWLAYSSDETGSDEVYVIPFPPERDSGRWMVSDAGGYSPVWSRDGTELYYINAATELVAVEILEGDRFAWGSRETLFSFDGYDRSVPMQRVFDVTPSGEFIGLKRRADVQFILVDNWAAQLRQ